MTTTTKVPTSNRIRAALLDIVQLARATTPVEVRHQNRVLREFDLEDLELIRSTQPPAPTAEDVFAEFAARDGRDVSALTDADRNLAIAFANQKIQAAFEAKFPADGGTGEVSVSQGAATILVGYLNRAGELFPAGKTPQGIDVPAGLPWAISRTLSPLIEALAEAFPALFPEDEAKAA